ncbi:unnamed protein product, partial [Ectocarpus sp. 12 AP-2014]
AQHPPRHDGIEDDTHERGNRRRVQVSASCELVERGIETIRPGATVMSVYEQPRCLRERRRVRLGPLSRRDDSDRTRYHPPVHNP